MSNCFIHLKQEACDYCSICHRPICKFCKSVNNSTCPRCANALGNALIRNNKNTLKWLIPLIIIRFTVYWDVVVCLFNHVNLNVYFYHLLILALTSIPLVISIMWYGIKIAFRNHLIGIRNPHEILERKKSKLITNYLIGIGSFFVLAVLNIFIMSFLIIMDIIHLIINIKDLIKYKKNSLNETQIRDLERNQIC